MKTNYKSGALRVAIFVTVVGLLGANTPAWAEGPVKDDPSKGVALDFSKQSSSYAFERGGGAPVRTRASNWTKTGALQASRRTTVTPPGGNAGTIFTSFSSNLTADNLGTTCSVNGTSSAAWLGLVPYNATSVTLGDEIWANAVAFISVSAGSGWGVNVGLNTAEVNQVNTVQNGFQNNHSYSGIQFSGALLNVNQSASANYRFGTSTFYQVVN